MAEHYPDKIGVGGSIPPTPTMTFVIYFINHFFCLFTEFLRHWYFDSFKIYSHFIISLLEKFDRKLAFKITLKHLFQPLFQDQTLIGYTLGFFFRIGRLISGGFLYLLIIFLAVVIYLIWLAVLPFIIYKILFSLTHWLTIQ